MGSSSRLVAVGISHHTANLEERERVAVAPDGIPNLLDRLREGGLSNEALLLSTCNRTELYAVQSHQGSVDKLVRFLAENGGVTDKAISDKIYRKCIINSNSVLCRGTYLISK